MVYEFNWRVIYCKIYSNVHMMKKRFVFWILFYFIFSLNDIWFIDYEKERNGDLCLGEKYTYKSWFACIYIVINKVYMVTTWSNSSELTFFFFLHNVSYFSVHCMGLQLVLIMNETLMPHPCLLISIYNRLLYIPHFRQLKYVN